jgi:hypothetical protein
VLKLAGKPRGIYFIMKNRLAALVCGITVVVGSGVVIAAQPLMLVPDGTSVLLSGEIDTVTEWEQRERNDPSRWQLEITQMDGRYFEGTVDLWAKNSLLYAKIYGEVSWGKVEAEIVNEEGILLGRADGAISYSGAQGAYQLIDGEEGNWTWTRKTRQ